MGEDSTAVGLEGALRDMWEPNCYGNPNRVTDPIYHCAGTDGGGVHINSGVDNRAFSLLVDGGPHNGVNVDPIGMTKAAHIWYRAQVTYHSPSTTFAQHADALEQSCRDLIGKNLKSLSTGAPSGEKITASDCSRVAKASLAVEFRTPPPCGFEPLLDQDPPAICPSSKKAPKSLFADNFEKVAASNKKWTTSIEGTTPDFTARKWSIVQKLPDGRRGKAYFAPDYPGGTCAPGGDETAVLHLTSKDIKLPAGAAPKVVFDHWVSAEPGFDGGNLKVSVNGGPWQVVPPAAFAYNSYNALLFNAAQGNTNPIGGQPAFTAADGGVTDGSWGRSIVDLTGLAVSGDKVKLRFDFGNDGCGGWVGWYVDNLKVLQCR
jgi:bacillolysin